MPHVDMKTDGSFSLDNLQHTEELMAWIKNEPFRSNRAGILMSEAEIFALQNITQKVAPKNIVEIGSWTGGSALVLAEAAPQATLWCVDPWEGISYNLDDPSKSMIAGLYFHFLKNTWHMPNIRHIRCRSDDLKWYGPKVDLVFIDGDHAEKGISTDLEVADRLVQSSGTICGHDYLAPGAPMGCDIAVKQVVDRWHVGKYKFHIHPGTSIFELTPLERS